MYRHRNRPKYTPEQLAEIYQTPHSHEKWPDHIARVQKTVDTGNTLLREVCVTDIADLSCGDAHIAKRLKLYEEATWYQKGVRNVPEVTLHLGDFAPGYEYQGPIEETIDQIPHVDLFVFSETIEHLDDPEAVLRQIREKSDRLLMSTPKMTWPDGNIEHYWAWDDEAIRAMLKATGWAPAIYAESYIGMGYTFQIWGAQ